MLRELKKNPRSPSEALSRPIPLKDGVFGIFMRSTRRIKMPKHSLFSPNSPFSSAKRVVNLFSGLRGG
jgi:hypothetical protein